LFVDDAVDRVRELQNLANRIGHSSEIDTLLSLLEEHHALGRLADLDCEGRRREFEERAGRQLLVALHEATLGMRFEEILEDEYRGIRPRDAQRMYLSICVLNRLGVPVRAGIIHRLHSIPFHEFQRRLSAPLQQLNIDYSDDRRAFRRMVQGRTLLDLFPSHEMVQQIYLVAQQHIGRDTYLLHQRAIYEMTRPNGNMSEANELLQDALALSPRDSTIVHSIAEHRLSMADNARTELEWEQLIADATQYARRARESHPDDAPPYHTLIKIGLARIRRALREPDDARASVDMEEAVRYTEKLVSVAGQRFPGDSYLAGAEAQLANLLRDADRAKQALHRAFRANPRQVSFATRLSKVYRDEGDIAAEREILEAALATTPGDTQLNYEYSLLRMRIGDADDGLLLYYLKRAFQPGDQNYDAQLLYARQLYVLERTAESRDLFRRISRARVGPDLLHRIRYPLAEHSCGVVARVEATYCFIARDGMGDWVYAHSNDISDDIWSHVQVGLRVRFRVGFTLKGPTALDVALE